MEQGIAAQEQIGKHRGCHTRYQDGQQRCHRQVDHQHLEGEHQTGNRGLEDTGDGSGGTTAHQQHQLFTVEVELLSDVRADGRASQHDGRLGTHRTTEADGDGRRDDRRPAVMTFQPRPLARDGIENPGDTMRDIVFHHIAHEQRGEIDTDDGVDKVQPVERRVVEPRGQQHLNLLDDPVQHVGRHRCQQSDDQCQQVGKHLIRYV